MRERLWGRALCLLVLAMALFGLQVFKWASVEVQRTMAVPEMIAAAVALPTSIFCMAIAIFGDRKASGLRYAAWLFLASATATLLALAAHNSTT